MNQNHKVMTDRHCTLIAGPFATFIQACLALVCISILIIKRQQENPRREWFIWMLDVMKQGIGACFGHFSNIYLSVLIASSLASQLHQSSSVTTSATTSIAAAILASTNSTFESPFDTSITLSTTSTSTKGEVEGDECQWYLLTYLVDSSVGILWNLLFLQIFECIVLPSPSLAPIFSFGDYGHPPQLNIFLAQLAVWLVIVMSGKLFIVVLLYQFILPINAVMHYLFQSLQSEPELELVLVMIVIPGVLNTVQFWITDTFLKQQVPSSSPTSLSHDLIESGDEAESSYDDEEEQGEEEGGNVEDDASTSPSFLLKKMAGGGRRQQQSQQREKSNKMRKRRGVQSFDYERLHGDSTSSPTSSAGAGRVPARSIGQITWGMVKYLYDVIGFRHIIPPNNHGMMSSSTNRHRGIEPEVAEETDVDVEGDGDEVVARRRRKKSIGGGRGGVSSNSTSPLHHLSPSTHHRREVAGGGPGGAALSSGSSDVIAISRSSSKRDDDVI